MMLGGVPVETVDSSSFEDSPLFIAVYGWFLIGKTTLAASATESEWGRPAHFLDIDGGLRSIAGMPGVTRTRILDWATWVQTLSDLAAQTSLPWRTLVVDNLSWLQHINLQKYTQGGTITPSFENGIWRKTADDLAGSIRHLRDIGERHRANVIINIWVDQREDKSGVRHQTFDLTPATAKIVPGLVDIVGYLEKGPDGVTRVLRLSSRDSTSPNGYRRSPYDTRAASIPDTIWNPSFGSIIDVLRGGKEWPTEKHAPPLGGQQQPTAAAAANDSKL